MLCRVVQDIWMVPLDAWTEVDVVALDGGHQSRKLLLEWVVELELAGGLQSRNLLLELEVELEGAELEEAVAC